MPDQHPPLIENIFYHVFNRAVGSEKLFRSSENYRYFLKKMEQHISPVADIYAYSLIPNHFHLLVQIKAREELEAVYLKKKGAPFDEKNHNLSRFVMQQFSNWLNGYTKAFNKMYCRMGALFMDYTKRTAANQDAAVNRFFLYIHKNAVHHGLTSRIGDWTFDSYRELTGNAPTMLCRKEVIEWFGSLQRFIQFHQHYV